MCTILFFYLKVKVDKILLYASRLQMSLDTAIYKPLINYFYLETVFYILIPISFGWKKYYFLASENSQSRSYCGVHEETRLLGQGKKKEV